MLNAKRCDPNDPNDLYVMQTRIQMSIEETEGETRASTFCAKINDAGAFQKILGLGFEAKNCDRYQRSKQQFGYADFNRYWLASAEIGQALGRFQLKGLCCIPAVIDASARPVRKPLVLIWSDNRLPPCLTPRQEVNTGGDKPAGQPTKSRRDLWYNNVKPTD